MIDKELEIPTSKPTYNYGIHTHQSGTKPSALRVVHNRGVIIRITGGRQLQMMPELLSPRHVKLAPQNLELMACHGKAPQRVEEAQGEPDEPDGRI